MTNANPPLLNASQLRCVRGDRELFSELSLSLHAGEILHIQGANGSGKTTLIRMLAGLIRPDDGEILWQDNSISADPKRYYADMRYIGHLTGIKLVLTPLQNLRFKADLLNQPLAMSAEAALEQVELYGFEEEPAKTLSAGQKRRIALASLLMMPGKLWLLDEPYTSLDTAGIAILESLLDQHLQAGGMAILASHSPVTLKQHAINTLQLLT